MHTIHTFHSQKHPPPMHLLELPVCGADADLPAVIHALIDPIADVAAAVCT